MQKACHILTWFWMTDAALQEPDEDDFEIIGSLDGHQETLWNRTHFRIVVEYLERWKDRFYLFSDTYPFYQVTKEELLKRPIKAGRGTNPTQIRPKTINRTISESGNKIALFSPRYEAEANKDRLSEAELARWITLYQGGRHR